MKPVRIGLVGFGFIGSGLFDRILADPRLEIAFVHNRSPGRLARVPEALRLADLALARSMRPDLIVEAAGPEVTRENGAAFLGFADYMPLSLSALADPAIMAAVEAASAGSGAASGHSLFIAHGALVGADSLFEWRAMWAQVTITFTKPPASIGLDRVGLEASAITQVTTVFDGTVREAARLFPHNVNAMVACALATVGLDRCRARLVADPAADVLRLAIEAVGQDGSKLVIERRQPAVGVSGTEMAAAAHRSMLRAAGLADATEFV